jgi:hypothetical protein
MDARATDPDIELNDRELITPRISTDAAPGAMREVLFGHEQHRHALTVAFG